MSPETITRLRSEKLADCLPINQKAESQPSRLSSRLVEIIETSPRPVTIDTIRTEVEADPDLIYANLRRLVRRYRIKRLEVGIYGRFQPVEANPFETHQDQTSRLVISQRILDLVESSANAKYYRASLASMGRNYQMSRSNPNQTIDKDWIVNLIQEMTAAGEIRALTDQICSGWNYQSQTDSRTGNIEQALGFVGQPVDSLGLFYQINQNLEAKLKLVQPTINQAELVQNWFSRLGQSYDEFLENLDGLVSRRRLVLIKDGYQLPGWPETGLEQLNLQDRINLIFRQDYPDCQLTAENVVDLLATDRFWDDDYWDVNYIRAVLEKLAQAQGRTITSYQVYRAG